MRRNLAFFSAFALVLCSSFGCVAADFEVGTPEDDAPLALGTDSGAISDGAEAEADPDAEADADPTPDAPAEAAPDAPGTPDAGPDTHVALEAGADTGDAGKPPADTGGVLDSGAPDTHVTPVDTGSGTGSDTGSPVVDTGTTSADGSVPTSFKCGFNPGVSDWTCPHGFTCCIGTEYGMCAVSATKCPAGNVIVQCRSAIDCAPGQGCCNNGAGGTVCGVC